MSDAWQQTACILCSINCGIEVQLDGRHLTRIQTRRSGVTFTVDEYEETWRRLATPDGRVNLAIPELLAELAALLAEASRRDPEFPFVLTAGERRSSTANTLFRNPAWRKKDAAGALSNCTRHRFDG